MRPISKRLALLLCTAVLSTSLFGCKKSDVKETTTSKTEQTKKDVKLKWYVRNLTMETSPNKSYNTQENLVELQKRTGVQIEFIDVPRDGADEQIKLMIASGDYPDIIQWKFGTASVTLANLYQDGVAIKLNELIDKNAPNLKKILSTNQEINKEIRLDDGAIVNLPNINELKSLEDKRMVATTGFVMRKDWLNNVNEKIPTTLAEWEKVLRAFKDKDPNGDGQHNEIPFDGTGLYMFNLAHGLRGTFYINPNTQKVSFGAIEPEYKNHIALMNKWYTEKLIGENTIKNDGKVVDAGITGDIIGSFKGLDNAWTKYLPGMKAKNPKAELVAVPWPKAANGKAYTERTELLTHFQQETTVITSKCKYPDEAMKLMDYMYSAEGAQLLSWGIEGKTYTVENGKKKFIQSLIDDKTQSMYVTPKMAFPKFGGNEAAASMNTPEQSLAQDTWGSADPSLLIPPALSFTKEENAKINEFNAQVGNYGNDMYNKFVLGQEPLSKYDDYVQQMKKMGIDEITKIYQAAYDRYKAR